MATDAHAPRKNGSRRLRLHEIIFEADTPGGKAFDVALLLAIVFSVVAVMLESVDSIDAEYHTALAVAEWSFTILFTIEYLTRLWVVQRPLLYARSFFGIVDLLSILPTFLSLFFGGAPALLVVRARFLYRAWRADGVESEFVAAVFAVFRAHVVTLGCAVRTDLG